MSGLAPLVYTSGFGFIGFWYLGVRVRERESANQAVRRENAIQPVGQPAVKLSSSISFPRVISLLVLSIIFIILIYCVLYIDTFSYQVVVFSGRP